MTPEGLALVAEFEGFRADAYRDMVGVWTIGYGETKGVKPGDVTTEPEARAKLQARLDEFERGVQSHITSSFLPEQSAAMTALAYNIGLGNFSTSSVLRLHNARDFAGAGDAFLKWDMAGGKHVPGLLRRRQAERAMYLTHHS
jgi:lysozyme